MKRTSYFDLLSKASAEQSLLMAAESNRLFADCPRKATHEFALPVQALVNYVMLPENEFLRIYIGRMLDGANQIHPINIKTPEDFFQQLDNALTALPQYDANFMAALPFYTILQPFMSNNYGFYFFTNEGVRPFFRDILQAYHDFLESPESRQYLNKSYGNWLRAANKTYR